MIFNAGSKYPSAGGTYGGITLSGNGSFNLSPPTTGTYAGIVIFQSRDNNTALTLSGNASGMTGTVYAPAAQLAESGNAQLNAAGIVDTMTISGNGVSNTVALSSPAGTVAYTPAQIRSAYGISSLGLDGTDQTIAIVDAYDDPDIDQALDTFDSQFGLTASGPTMYQQYGPASSFLTVLNQYGQATSLPSTDPDGPGTNNWEVEESLDVEWAHAIAPGAQIILVEANSQSLSDLMASVATAASQPGVSVVSMSWGFAEGQAVFAADEAAYDRVFNVPGVTFVASTGDYGAADPEYPAFSPNVVAVGGTSLYLASARGKYSYETAWGGLAGAGAGGGGLSTNFGPPTFQSSNGVNFSKRAIPDVSMVADPVTAVSVYDSFDASYNNDGDPWTAYGGTSVAAPVTAGVLGLAQQDLIAASKPILNSVQADTAFYEAYNSPSYSTYFHDITLGNNSNVNSRGRTTVTGFNATTGYDEATGIGSLIANTLVPYLASQ
jgi:subtilase family serine protease